MSAATRAAERADDQRTSAEAILQPGRNCWRVDRAHRFFCVQDAAEYFRLVRKALLAARRTVFILGWDTTAHTDLEPGSPKSDAPTRLDRLLAYVARRRPALRCYILTWDYGALYTLERDPLTRWRLGWRMPRGIRFGFDDHHPVGASHHQKIVVVDDQLAFCGGIDLTGHRWDTSAHRVDEPARVTPLGKAYGPYHEVQVMVEGPVAASLGALARERWRAVGTERLPPPGRSSEPLWPSDVTPDLQEVNVAISRTLPGSEKQPPIRECEALFLDSIAMARRSIYIESQYFTNDTLGEALASRLRDPAGPEVIVVSPKECHGWLEQNTMCTYRDAVFQRLVAADVHKRLRLVYPAASRIANVPIFVHSKVMIVDDTFVRIGSANFSRRSMGVDTECDLAAEGFDPAVRTGVRHILDRLVAEQLHLSVEDVRHGIERLGSLRALIDTREHEDHTLVPIEVPSLAADPPPSVVRAVADPDEPVGFGSSIGQLIPGVDAVGGSSPLRIWILPGLVVLTAIAVAWASSASVKQPELHALQDALRALPGRPFSVPIGAGVFLLAGLLLVPLEVLAVLAGVLFGAGHGGSVGLIGSIAAAALGYAAGRAIGPAGLSQWMSRRSFRSVRQLGARGIIGILLLRLSAVASAGSIHLLCGASRVPFGAYMTGTIIGLAPVIAALTGLGALLRHTLLQPSIVNGLITMGAGLALMAVAAGLRAFLLIRQFAPSVASHRQRAEFG